MSTCTRCGSQTTRRRLCKSCGLAELHGQSLIEEGQALIEKGEKQGAEETMDVECAGCGLVHEVGMNSRKTCPDCGHEGYRPVEALQ